MQDNRGLGEWDRISPLKDLNVDPLLKLFLFTHGRSLENSVNVFRHGGMLNPSMGEAQNVPLP
jgi:hypothetical protein